MYQIDSLPWGSSESVVVEILGEPQEIVTDSGIELAKDYKGYRNLVYSDVVFDGLRNIDLLVGVRSGKVDLIRFSVPESDTSDLTEYLSGRYGTTENGQYGNATNGVRVYTVDGEFVAEFYVVLD